MKNILAIFKEDLKKLFGNVVNGIVTLGLILLPSIFALYNIIACWDVFDNTGNVMLRSRTPMRVTRATLFPYG